MLLKYNTEIPVIWNGRETVSFYFFPPVLLKDKLTISTFLFHVLFTPFHYTLFRSLYFLPDSYQFIYLFRISFFLMTKYFLLKKSFYLYYDHFYSPYYVRVYFFSKNCSFYFSLYLSINLHSIGIMVIAFFVEIFEFELSVEIRSGNPKIWFSEGSLSPFLPSSRSLSPSFFLSISLVDRCMYVYRWARDETCGPIFMKIVWGTLWLNPQAVF